MSEFEAALRSQIDQARQALVTARQAGMEGHPHDARIRDLLELAAEHDINTTGWMDPAVLDATTTCGS